MLTLVFGGVAAIFQGVRTEQVEEEVTRVPKTLATIGVWVHAARHQEIFIFKVPMK